MTVAHLIALLQAQDPEAKVIVYSELDEGCDWAHDVMSAVGGEYDNRPYVKGDWIDYKKGQKLVIIR